MEDRSGLGTGLDRGAAGSSGQPAPEFAVPGSGTSEHCKSEPCGLHTPPSVLCAFPIQPTRCSDPRRTACVGPVCIRTEAAYLVAAPPPKNKKTPSNEKEERRTKENRHPGRPLYIWRCQAFRTHFGAPHPPAPHRSVGPPPPPIFGAGSPKKHVSEGCGRGRGAYGVHFDPDLHRFASLRSTVFQVFLVF